LNERPCRWAGSSWYPEIPGYECAGVVDIPGAFDIPYRALAEDMEKCGRLKRSLSIPVECQSHEAQQKGEKTECNEQDFRTIEPCGRCFREQTEIPRFAPVDYKTVGREQGEPDAAEEKGNRTENKGKYDLGNRHEYGCFQQCFHIFSLLPLSKILDDEKAALMKVCFRSGKISVTCVTGCSLF
jgi:hypothetical protein